MRAIHVSSLSVIGAAVLTFVAPATALAEEEKDITSFGFTVTPSTIAPGGTVTLNATECEVPTVKVSSGVFDTVTLNEGRSGTAQVYDDAKPGAEYEVTFECKGEKGTAPLTITGGQGKHEDPGMRKPDGGVKAGAGGSFSDLSATQIAIGSALVAGGLGGGAFLLRRRTGDGL